MIRGAGVAAALGVLALLLHPDPRLHAQTPDDLRSACLAAGGDHARCSTGSVAARALLGDLGLSAGLGSEVPGSASTLGRRIGNSPRLAWSVRGSGVRAAFPDVFHEGADLAPPRSFLAPSVQVGLAAGLLEGFSPVRTVGGVLSLDLMASVAFLMPPSSQGFGGSVNGLTFGLRAGLLRESFTVPGISVSISRRFVGDVILGDTDLGDPVAIAVDPAVTSVRATVGKDLFGIGFLVGTGRDHLDGVVRLRLVVDGPDPVEVGGPLDTQRDVYFGGLALNLPLLQLSLEGGWAAGLPGVPAGASGSIFEVGRGAAFASLALRFTP